MANQSELEKSLLEAIGYLVDNRVQNVDRDKTITATIVSCDNALEGKYKIQYNDGILTAYAQDGASYNTNQTVYVLIPLGDFSKKKTIVGKASNVSDDNNLTFVSSMLNSYNMIGRNVITDENNQTPIGLNTYYKDDYVLLYDRDYPEESLLQINQDEFLSYIKNADALLIEGTFQTRLPRAHRLSKTGIYGVQFVLAFKDQDNPEEVKHLSYVLDTNSMTGNPLLYTQYTNQYAIYPIDTENFLYIESILAYSNDFVAEDDISNVNLWGDDIFIKEFEIYGLQEISSTNGDYTLRLSTPQGALFKSLRPEETLSVVASTLYQVNTDLSDSSSYYWFAKDDRINATSEEYQMYGGAGWRFMKDMGYNKSITLKASDNRAYENVYMVVSVYKESVILKQTFTIYNEAARRDIEIESDLGLKFSFDRGTPTLTCLVNGRKEDFDDNHDDSLFSFSWSRIDENGTTTSFSQTYEELEKQYNQAINDGLGYSQIVAIKNQMLAMQGVEFDRNVLKYPIKQIDSKATFSCSVYLRETPDATEHFVGAAEITLQNENTADPNDYYILIENGDQVFQYSESGVSPASERYTDPLEIKPLDCHFYDPAGLEVNPETYSVKWKVPTESTLIVMPAEGMNTNPANDKLEWYTQATYPTAIADSYDYQALNNQVTCIVTYDGQDYMQDTNFLFVKVGDNGTNGMDMVGKVSAITEPKEGRLALVIRDNDVPRWNTGESAANAGLKFELYQRNELINLENTYWTISGNSSKFIDVDMSTGIISWEPQTGSNLLTNLIVRAQTTFESQDYYAFYPVPVINYKNSDSYAVVLDKTKTLKDILYNADGRNPLYNKNQGIFFTLRSDSELTRYITVSCEGGTTDGESTAAFFISSNRDDDTNEDISTYSIGEEVRTNEEIGFFVHPDDIYDGSFTNNRVHVKIYMSRSAAQNNGNTEAEFYVPIHMSLNTFGLASLNAWDGNHIEINEDGNYIVAPQIGAGVKDENNRFTGIVMGTAKTYDQDEASVGLLGYSKGKQSIWLDADTGNAIFGLPEDQASTNNQYSEGRIELAPGGESKIGMWNIGSRALYNMNRNGAGVPDTDMDPYPDSYNNNGEYTVKDSQIAIPHDAQGVILNANPAYASFKGMPLDDDSGIDFGNVNTVIQRGDSLEVEIDPAKPSIFSIFRHTPYEGDVDTGKWHRYPLVGINSNGQFYTNAIEDGESSMGIGKIGAFGSLAAAGKYVGAQFAYKSANIFKFFLDEDDSDVRTRPLYLSTGTSETNEYARPFNIYGKTVNLYASNGNSISKTSPTGLTIATSNVKLFTSNSNISMPNQNTGTMSIDTDANLSITNDDGRNVNLSFGTTTLRLARTLSATINPLGSRAQTAINANVLGKINISGLSDLAIASDSSSGSWKMNISNSAATTGVDNSTAVTNSQILLGNNIAKLELNNATVTRLQSSRGINLVSSGGNGIHVSSDQGSINLDASWKSTGGASAYLHLTPASDGYSSFYLNSGYGSIRSVGSAQGFSRNGVQITDGVFTPWGQFTGTIAGSNNTIIAQRDIRSSNGWLYGGNFSFNTSKSWNAHGGTYNSASLEQHLANLYSLVNGAYNRADAAYNRAADYYNSHISGSLSGYATRSWVDSNYVSGSRSDFVTASTYNNHTHYTCGSGNIRGIVSYIQTTVDGSRVLLPNRLADLTTSDTGRPH